MQIKVHHRCHKLDRIIRLQISGLIAHQPIGSGVRLVKTVICELIEQVPDLGCLTLLDLIFLRPRKELRLLRIHRFLDFLTHSPAQHICAAEGVSRHLSGNLHHLFLIDDDALRLIKDRIDQRMNALPLLALVLDVAVFRNVFHRPRTIERNERNNVLYAGRPQLAQRITHPRALHLKHANRICAAIKIVSRLVVERYGRQINLRPPRLQNINGPLQDCQCFQAEEIELHQSGRLNPFHVKLRHRHIRARITIERDQLVQRPVPDHNTSGVSRRIAQQPFDRLPNIQQSLDRLVSLFLFFQARFLFTRADNRHRLNALDRDHLRQAVYLPIRHLQHTPDIAHRRLRLQGSKSNNLRDPVPAIAALNVGNHFLAPILTKIDVEIRHRNTLRIEKPLEQQTIAQRIKVGNRQRPGHQRPRPRSTPRPDRNIVVLRPFDKICNDQKVTGKAHPLDDTQLKIKPLVILLTLRCHGLNGEARIKTITRLTAQFLNLVIGKFRQDFLTGQRAISASLRNLDRRLNRFGQVIEQSHHFIGAFQVMFRR